LPPLAKIEKKKQGREGKKFKLRNKKTGGEGREGPANRVKKLLDIKRKTSKGRPGGVVPRVKREP